MRFKTGYGMSTPMHVSAQARDLTFKLNDSCNWCCWCCQTDYEDRQVYVNEDGHVVYFDPKKADDERRALQETVKNLQTIIHQMAVTREHDKNEILHEVESKIIQLREDDPRPVTVDMVRKILNILEKPPYPPTRPLVRNNAFRFVPADIPHATPDSEPPFSSV